MSFWESFANHAFATVIDPALATAEAPPAAQFWVSFANHAFVTIIYTVLGLVFFALSFWIIAKITPFSVRKEIEEDQNVALAVVIASVFIGIALIIAAAIHG